MAKNQNRMSYSEATSHADKACNASRYAYNALGRRALTESTTGQVLRTVYDGLDFESIREAFRNGTLTTQFADSTATRGTTPLQGSQPTGSWTGITWDMGTNGKTTLQLSVSLGKYAEALNDINKSLALDSTNKSAYGFRGGIYLALSQQTGDINKRNEYLEKAEDDYEKYNK
jgi:tetratricopeptide (TPR) repeat protein